jgi:hypothetical protein
MTTHIRGIKPAPVVDPTIAEIEKFYALPVIAAELKRTDANTAVLVEWLKSQNVEVLAHTLAAAYTVCKPQLELIPAPPPKRLPNIGADSGGAPTGRVNHAAPKQQESSENRVSVLTGFDAMLEKSRKNRAERDAAKKAEEERYAQSSEARRAKVPPRIG